MQEMSLLSDLLEAGYQVSPQAAELITSHNNPRALVNHILGNVDDSVFVIDVDDIDFTGFEEVKEAELPCKQEPVTNTSSANPISVLSDITDCSTCVGEYMEFVQYFRNRYSRLSEMIRGRVNARPMESLKGKRRVPGDEISIIGMVSEIKNTSNGHRLVRFEDPTGSFQVLFSMNDKDIYEGSNKLVLDDVVGVSGNLTNDGKLLIAKKLVFPDLPNMGLSKNGSQGKALFISDVHIGSNTFLQEQWDDFMTFVTRQSDNPELNKIAQQLRYIVVSGDIVDGVGIYPGQENELTIPDIYDQYEEVAHYFNQIPSDITVVIGPGNHDAVRQAEPQPTFPERIRKMFDPRIKFVGNPALVDLDGVLVLMYHGRSIDDFVANIQGISYSEPEKAMLEMVKRRHLSPTYGSRVSIAPEKTDHFVIDHIPDILHCGHVHTVGVKQYRGTLLINSGTWQDQTEFQKRVNVVPEPARVPVVDLATFQPTMLQF
ncbi:DNA-directed DNA polymerase II small subunit [Methanohalophilus sp. RSK]|uniref:DNA-directed DNA polymerase II small subunit n=1 Tax=Methanohalophilus sp. RSK TaxID=2485783 RepID=UPI000F43B069|nr:DNA-directed DNA polymerase II small subunit [Methanohalophilus sp. RSK]RNI15707.1 DNA-directed DNA polymerase II small subunit [Methanohalophilus sp. RSK]